MFSGAELDKIAKAWFASSGQHEVTLLLFTFWDPIGVNGYPEAWQEYRRYTEPVVRAVLAGLTSSELAGYLVKLAEKEMEIDAPHDDVLASKIIRWIKVSLYAFHERSSG